MICLLWCAVCLLGTHPRPQALFDMGAYSEDNVLVFLAGRRKRRLSKRRSKQRSWARGGPRCRSSYDWSRALKASNAGMKQKLREPVSV